MSILVELLDDAQRHAPEYDDGLADHLPMALVALQRLGAGDERLRAFAAGYAQRLAPAPAAAEWPAGDAWPGRFGDLAAYPAYRALFTEWRLLEGAGDVLSQVLPQLMDGCAAAAFHGLIRTAYAVQAHHAGEFASGLAYWACRHQPLGELPAEPGTEPEPEALLRRLPARRSRHRLIAERMQAAASDRALRRAVAQLAIGEHTLEALARLAARAYAGSGSLTALHLVTATHALRVLLPFVDDREAALRRAWQAFAVAVVSAGFEARPEPAPRPWAAIVAAAVASDDEHVIKLVDSCREHEALYGGEVWRTAATRAVEHAGA